MLAPCGKWLLCPEHFLRVREHQLVCRGILGWKVKVRYWACRACGRLEPRLVKRVVMVVDEGMQEEVVWDGEVVRVNWWKRRKLVDLDEVEVGSADDFDVQHFCIQFGNDPDLFRKPRKRRVCCRIWADSNIAGNSTNNLRNMFRGRVIDERQ